MGVGVGASNCRGAGTEHPRSQRVCLHRAVLTREHDARMRQVMGRRRLPGMGTSKRLWRVVSPSDGYRLLQGVRSRSQEREKRRKQLSEGTDCTEQEDSRSYDSPLPPPAQPSKRQTY